MKVRGAGEAAYIDVDRMRSFSDNIYAFAMTLLITGIHLPDIPREEIAVRLLEAIAQEWRQLAVYAVSFLNIGSYWLLHHHIYAYLERMDKVLIWLNLLLLLSVTFLPFPTGLMGKYGRDSATALLYGLAISLSYFMLVVLAAYIHMHQDLTRAERRLPPRAGLLARFGLPLLLALIGMGLSFADARLSFLLYFGVALVNTVPWQASFHEGPSDVGKEPGQA